MNMKWLATATSAVVATVVIVPNWGLAGDSAQFSVQVTGHVSPSCHWTTGGTIGNVELAEFTDTNARIIEQPYALELGDMSCNQRASVSLKTLNGGMKYKDKAGAACGPGGNSLCVNYLATADWNDASVTYETDGTQNKTVSSEPSSTGGNHAVQVTVTPKKPIGDMPVIAGEFLDTLTVQVSPVN